MPPASQKKKEYMKKYYLANCEKLKESNKKYYMENGEKQKEYMRNWRVENPDYQKDWNLTNPDYQADYHAEWLPTPSGRKCSRISNWKTSGMKCENDDWDSLYERYMNTDVCDNDKCKCILVTDGPMCSSTKVVDHSHKTGWFRNILCHSCNVKRRENNFSVEPI